MNDEDIEHAMRDYEPLPDLPRPPGTAKREWRAITAQARVRAREAFERVLRDTPPGEPPDAERLIDAPLDAVQDVLLEHAARKQGRGVEELRAEVDRIAREGAADDLHRALLALGADPADPASVERVLLPLVDKPAGGRVLRARRDEVTGAWLFHIEVHHR